MTPSAAHRQDLRWAVRAFSSHDDEARLFVEPINRLVMDDLEAAFELVMGYPATVVEPAGYRRRRP